MVFASSDKPVISFPMTAQTLTDFFKKGFNLLFDQISDLPENLNRLPFRIRNLPLDEPVSPGWQGRFPHTPW
jgi:hypothetical protein